MFYLPLFLLSEAVERVAALLLSPLAYVFRHAIRTDEVLMWHEQARVKK